MATFIPSIDKILQFKVKPEAGELELLLFLEKMLDDSFEVYFNPYMNGDRPDILIMRKGYGVMIVEVKDWNLDLYRLNEKKHWILGQNNSVIKSPIQQVLKYKDNLFELHIESLLEKKIKDIRKFNIVSCAVYFHNANESQIKDMIVNPYENDRKYQDFLKYNIDLIGRDNLNELDLNKILERRYLKAKKESFLFTTDLYESFKRFLNPPIHMKEEGVDFLYSPKQREIIYEQHKKQQRIKGVVGSGKTTVLAARAVQAYKRISKYKPNVQILILTYNITLKNFIHDKISMVREEFPWEAFVISNYHLFINSQLNNLGIPFEKEKITDLEGNYYSNKKLFLEQKSKIRTYDAIFIDEIQDYKRPWMEIIKECFLSEDGEYVLFGDVKQNIYSNPTEQKDVSTNVRGVTELKRCFRSDFKIKDLAVEYQKNIFRDKYEIDSFNKNESQGELQFERNQQGDINYMYLSNSNLVSTLYTIIYENILSKNNNQISPNDITILGYTIGQLKRFEAYYRYASGEKTKTMFETYEIMYMNRLKKYSLDNIPEWVQAGIRLIKRDKDKKNEKGINQLAKLLTIYDLYVEYPDRFKQKMEWYCAQFKCSLIDFLTYIDNQSKEFVAFKSEVYGADYHFIRTNKKIHFWMNSGTIKISTINSFKGWESELVFLILEPKYDHSTEFNLAFDELLYTAITRCRSKLVIINFGNDEYDKKMRPIIDSVK
ncbi:hypothetical protein M2138_000598 [Dysgonomonadaceae bacterium PH5-43]|nr:hypothetical protein [Dysgonomonadaceae bacterium PH5-43]